jgi:hypothetical protein
MAAAQTGRDDKGQGVVTTEWREGRFDAGRDVLYKGVEVGAVEERQLGAGRLQF